MTANEKSVTGILKPLGSVSRIKYWRPPALAADPEAGTPCMLTRVPGNELRHSSVFRVTCDRLFMTPTLAGSRFVFGWTHDPTAFRGTLKLQSPSNQEAGEDSIMKEFQNLYASLNIIMVIKSRRLCYGKQVVSMGEMRNAYNILVGKPERKSPLGRPRRRWENNIGMGVGVVDWIHLA